MLSMFKMTWVISIGVMVFGSLAAGARQIVVPPQPVSSYADTEVSTNIQFSASSEHTREIVRPQFAFLLHQTEMMP